MKAPDLKTSSPDIILVAPDVDRDAPLGVGWLNGVNGTSTLLLMGVPGKKINRTTLEAEKGRVRDFLSKDDQLNWMIQFRQQIVGTIWVDLCATKELPAPSISIMIGDAAARGHGVGGSSVQSVVGYMFEQGEDTLYSRMLVENVASASLMKSKGFRPLGSPYVDDDILEWQNVSLSRDAADINV